MALSDPSQSFSTMESQHLEDTIFHNVNQRPIAFEKVSWYTEFFGQLGSTFASF